MAETALIVGTGSNLSASLARLFAREGMAVALAARDTGKLAKLAGETGAKCYACDASKTREVARLFDEIDRDLEEHLEAQRNYRRVLEQRDARARRRVANA